MPRSRRTIVAVLVLVSVASPAITASVAAGPPGTPSHATVQSVDAEGHPAAVQATDPDLDVSNVTYTGDGLLNASADRLELWRSGAHEFTATVAADAAFDGEACLVATADGGGQETIACSATTVAENATRELAVGVDAWPETLVGSQTVSVELRSNGSTVATGDPLSLTVLRKSGDLDGDGLSNERELSVGSDLRRNDTDGDGLEDGPEVKNHGTSPTKVDTDGDGLGDRAEIEVHGTDPTKADTDGDGLGDRAEIEVHGTDPTKADTDGDGLDDAAEVNTYETDPTKADTDGDGLGDGVEIERHGTNPTKTDTDGDGLNDALEVNTYETDPTKADTDGDGLDDGAEVNRYGTDPLIADSDGDGLDDGAEVNRWGTEPRTADSDDDGLDDGAEVNRYGTDPTKADTDGDGVDDGAEITPAPWNRVPAPVVVFGALATVMSVAGSVLYRSDRGVETGLDRLLADGDDGADDPDGPAATAATEAATEDVPPEFLSNEERILRLLADNDGRMRQAAIVERTGWSKSKVSRVLAEMADGDEIVKVDVGKGNVITLPDRVPPGAQSPFEK